MADIKEWCQPETTKKAIYDGLYPVVITACSAFANKIEEDGGSYIDRGVSLTFKTLTDVPFPDQTNGRIIVEKQFSMGKDFLKNAFNGIARAAGIPEFKDTQDFDAKTLMIGFTNYSYTNNEGVEITLPQVELFSHAPMCENSKIEFIATEHPNVEFTKELKREWFKSKVALYKSPK